MLITPFDNLQNVLGGVLRSIGKEKQSTKFYLFTYYPLAFPLSIVFSHYLGWRVYGLYGAMLVAKGLNTLGSIYFLSTTKLSDQIDYVVKRVQENKAKITADISEKSDNDLGRRLAKSETWLRSDDDARRFSTKESSFITKKKTFNNFTKSDDKPYYEFSVYSSEENEKSKESV
jgi:hypothetical protein